MFSGAKTKGDEDMEQTTPHKTTFAQADFSNVLNASFRKRLAAICIVAVLSLLNLTAAHAEPAVQQEVAVIPPVFMQLEITSHCTESGAVFKIINRGPKWPKTGFLRLYRVDGKSLVGERRLRLAEGQRASFVVKNKVMAGSRFGVWIDPTWYKREMEFDASIRCG